MKLYCRFAPPYAPLTTEVESKKEEIHASFLQPLMVLLSLREEEADGKKEAKPEQRQQRLTVVDPNSGSVATSVCQRVFFPHCLPVNITEKSSSVAIRSSSFSFTPRTRQESRQQQEEVFDEVVRPFLPDLVAGKRCAFLAYGQTATGKTYTMFGPNAEGETIAVSQRQEQSTSISYDNFLCDDKGCEKENDNENEGIVPRLFRAIFDDFDAAKSHKAVSFVDIFCFEVYNENTIDLIAFLLNQQRQQLRKLTRKKEGGAKHRNDAENIVSNDLWKMWLRHLRGGGGGGAGEHDASRGPTGKLSLNPLTNMSLAQEKLLQKVVYKPTEKTKVMHSALCLRCESAEECMFLLRKLLALRRRSKTQRNVCSSRSHFLLRIMLHSNKARLGEALLVDLAGSETCRNNMWTDSGVLAAECDFDPLQSRATTAPPVASTFTASCRDSSGLTAAERNSLHTNEMRCINSSLLALRNVVRILCSTSRTGLRVPFRDSTLTTILEPFLVPGGESIAVWIVCCSTRQCDFHETVESLRVGADVSAIPTSVQPYSFLCLVNPTDKSSVGCLEMKVDKEVPAAVVETNDSATTDVSFSSMLANGDEQQQRRLWRKDVGSGAVIPRGSNRGDSKKEKGAFAFSLLDNTSVVHIDGKNKNKKIEQSEADLQNYRDYAQHLLEHCKTLCERYDECVEELARTKQALALRDRDVERLQKALEEACSQQQCSGVPPPPPAPSLLLLPSSSWPFAVTGEKNVMPAPPAWLRKGAMYFKNNDMKTIPSHPHASYEKQSLTVTTGGAGVEGHGEEGERNR